MKGKKKMFCRGIGGGFAPDDFVVEITLTGADTFILPLASGETYNFMIDWGDGSGVDTITEYDNPDATHTFPGAGVYQLKMSGILEVWDTQFASTTDRNRITDVIQWGDTGAETIRFRYCDNIAVSAPDAPIESSSISHVQKFRHCDSLVSIDAIDLWDFGKNLDTMFFQAGNYNQDLSGQDFTNTTSMNNFLDGANFSTTNYDALLIALDTHGTLQNGVTLDVGITKYSSGASTTARANIISNWSWTILDGGQV